jgi:uncharacterized secreted protein with C-terminal beta-propeller domain
MKKYIYLTCLLFSLIAIIPQGVFADTCNPDSLKAVVYREKSDNVKNLQTCLIQLGYNISAPTGYYGNETLKAVKSYYLSWYGNWSGLRFGPAGINKLKSGFVATSNDKFELGKFNSEEEYQKYLENSQGNSYGYYRLGGSIAVDVAVPTASLSGAEQKNTSAVVTERYSDTNTQVLGIDEPDIVKTDGQNIFYKNYFSGISTCPEGAKCIMMPARTTEKVSLIKALPPEDMSVLSQIDVDGYNSELLLKDNNLIILGNNITDYNISDKNNPGEKWSLELADNSRIISSRLYNGKLYVVSASYTNSNKCPISILKDGLMVACSDIYYPKRSVTVDSNYNIMSIDVESGKITNSFSFLGSDNSSTVYMSENNLYIAYNYYEDILKYYVKFIKENASDLISSSVLNRLDTISSYDISNNSKWNEFQTELEKYYNGLSDDESLRIKNEFNNRLTVYSKEHYRDIEKTAIVKINLDNLNIVSTGNIPGKLLNQFSLDEYNGVLRAATTIGNGWNNFGITTGGSVSDVYTLDSSLNVLGSVKGLGATEKIYSVRFLGNRGYVVTFRQVDPFYVLDLSNPSSPLQKGELKIPGYSSYLHPITDNIILGVGEEDNKVKISLFDVSSPENPTEVAKYNLDDYWTEISSNHHAFMIDKKHEIFFIPGSEGGYIFSYKDNKLSLTKSISGYNIKRAVYINDYLYILGDSKITVFNENNWEKVKEMDIK